MKFFRRFLRFFSRAVAWSFTVLCVFICSLLFREQHIPGDWVAQPLQKCLPTNMVLFVDSARIGFRHGISADGIRLYDKSGTNILEATAAAKSLRVDPLRRRMVIAGLTYKRLPSGYYSPGNKERNSRVGLSLPRIPSFKLVLERPEILGVEPLYLDADVSVKPDVLEVKNLFLKWPGDERRLSLSGECTLDLGGQRVYGQVRGFAKKSHIRPMLVVLDVPVSLPYMDGFTDVAEPVEAGCRWNVNLINNDLDLWLDLKPTSCKYNTVAMEKADGEIHIHNYTRDDCLNYRTVVGPVSAVSASKKCLAGTITVTGTNSYNVVDIEAVSDMPVADVLKIAGFEDDYVDYSVYGTMEGRLQFRFPRSMTNNYEVMNGFGSVRIKDGQLMRMKGFSGLVEILAEKIPGVAYVTDRTQAKADYVIEDGVLKTDGIYIEGGLFSMMMYGTFDIAKDELDFTVRTQLMKDESVMGKIVRPITWVFSKLLLEFRLTGSCDNPRWKYISVIDRVVDAVNPDSKDADK